MINWKTKLTSRKFWAALIAIAIALVVALFRDKLPDGAVDLLGKGIFALCVYIFGESGVDIARTIWSKVTDTGTADTGTMESADTGNVIATLETAATGEVDVSAVGIHNKEPEDNADNTTSE